MTTEKDIQNNDDNQFDERYDEKLMDHDYDGIQELDNPAPAWIMAIFYITITFAVFYGAYYFWFGQGPTQEEEYIADCKAHDAEYKAAQGNSADIKLLTDEASLAEGAQIFVEMGCTACHGAKGEGNAIGPNLTDNSWINGCGFDNVFNTIKNGKAPSMPEFKSKMSEQKIQKVASYILGTLHGSNPENAKAAQGEECK